MLFYGSFIKNIFVLNTATIIFNKHSHVSETESFRAVVEAPFLGFRGRINSFFIFMIFLSTSRYKQIILLPDKLIDSFQGHWHGLHEML